MCGKEHAGGYIAVNTLLTEQNPTWALIRNRMAVDQMIRAEAAVNRFRCDLNAGKLFTAVVI